MHIRPLHITASTSFSLIIPSIIIIQGPPLSKLYKVVSSIVLRIHIIHHLLGNVSSHVNPSFFSHSQ